MRLLAIGLVICLVAGCASSVPVHQVNIKSTFQDQDRDVFSDADMLQTYWTTMRAGDPQDGSRRARDFFNQEQSDGMAREIESGQTVVVTAEESVDLPPPYGPYGPSDHKICEFHIAGDSQNWWASCSAVLGF